MDLLLSFCHILLEKEGSSLLPGKREGVPRFSCLDDGPCIPWGLPHGYDFILWRQLGKWQLNPSFPQGGGARK